MADTEIQTRSPWRHALFQLVLARLTEFRREPAAIFWVYVFPLIMVMSLGIAFRNRQVEALTAIIPTGPAGDLVDQVLKGDARFVTRRADEEGCRRQLRTGKADLMIVPTDTTPANYDYFYDPTKPLGLLARNSADDVLQRAAGRKDVITARLHEVTEPGGRYIDFLVPGLLGMGLMGGGLWGVGFAIVDMRIRKLLKRYLATPMKRGHFLAGIMISRLLFTIPEILILLVFARLMFGVTSQGSYLAILTLILLGAFQFAGIGLLVASRAQTLETVSGLMNLVMLPMWLGSGIFFSADRFPGAAQPLIAALPLTPLIAGLRRVMLEGAGFAAIGQELLVITVWGVTTFFLALRWFRWN